MYIPLYGCFVKYVSDYGTYAERIVLRNRYGRHGKRKAN